MIPSQFKTGAVFTIDVERFNSNTAEVTLTENEGIGDSTKMLIAVGMGEDLRDAVELWLMSNDCGLTWFWSGPHRVQGKPVYSCMAAHETNVKTKGSYFRI